MRDYPILHLKQNEVREHKKLSNITLEIKIKQEHIMTVKCRTAMKALFLCINLCLSVALDSLARAFALFPFKCNIG
jgi:hypothetical protein